MGIKTDKLNGSFRAFIEKQAMFFVSSAAPEGLVNVSPKGADTLRIIDEKNIVWLSLSGSGNETAAHLLKSPRLTMMFCAFDGDALILRIYGTAKVIYPRHDDWNDLYRLFPNYAGARNIFQVSIDMVTTSCGTGVPEMMYQRQRADTELVPWYDEMGAEGVSAYWRKKNTHSLDDYPTGIIEVE